MICLNEFLGVILESKLDYVRLKNYLPHHSSFWQLFPLLYKALFVKWGSFVERYLALMKCVCLISLGCRVAKNKAKNRCNSNLVIKHSVHSPRIQRKTLHFFKSFPEVNTCSISFRGATYEGESFFMEWGKLRIWCYYYWICNKKNSRVFIFELNLILLYQ